MPEIIKATDEQSSVQTKLKLREYQEFIGKYLDYNSPYRNILIYHGLGSGKTLSAINIYNVLYSFSSGWNVFILIKAALHNHPWLDDLDTWLEKEDRVYRMKNIYWVHYDSPIADKSFMETIKTVDSSKKNLYIIDEAHNFIRNVYSNINSKTGKRAQVIYDHIVQDVKENDGTRVVCLSGTPAINTPYELALLFNLLRPNIFPKSESLFNQFFLSNTKFQVLNEKYKNMFQRRILGLVSYYIGATPDRFATQTVHFVDVPMSELQEDIYNYYESIEENIAKKSRGTGGQETYKTYTRQAANFVFPPISQNVNGESRPRPGKFRLSEREAEKINTGKLKTDKTSDKYRHVQKYYAAIDIYVREFDEYLEKKNDADINNKHTLHDDIQNYTEKYKGDFNSFNAEEKNKSSIYKAMYESSPKMLCIILNIIKSNGPVLVYSNYVIMEGLQIFKIYLKYFGYRYFKQTEDMLTNPKYNNFRYADFTGAISKEDRSEVLQTYNKIENKHGNNIKIIMISPAGAEGISLSNVRQIHLMEPYWHETRMIQMIGRGVRLDSHKNLPVIERHVDVFRYKSIHMKATVKMTTDQYIEELARTKDGLIQSFLEAMKEAAVDCGLNAKHNMAVQEYKCFQFEEPSLFDKNIGPAYKDDLYDDIKIDNGSNSLTSMTVKVKVIKIQAVQKLHPEEEQYSSPATYWYSPDSRVVYDYDLHYPVGKIGIDEDNVPIKLNKETYIIDQVIPIPMLDM